MKYHKIQTLFKRDPSNKHKTLLIGEYANPELEFLKDCVWEFTEKVDGTNTRVIWKDGTVSFAGKTDDAVIPYFLLSRLQELFPVEKFEHLDEMVLYGEGVGPKIQKGGENYTYGKPYTHDFILFDIFCGGLWLSRNNVFKVADVLHINVAETVGMGPLSLMVEMVEQGLLSRLGKQDFFAEGIIARPLVELFDRRGNRIITKLKTRDFSGEKK